MLNKFSFFNIKLQLFKLEYSFNMFKKKHFDLSLLDEPMYLNVFSNLKSDIPKSLDTESYLAFGNCRPK